MQNAEMIVDRFEGDFAVLEREDGVCENVPRETLPAGCREGSVLRESGGGFVLDEELERKRRAELHRMQQNLFS